ncbi:hypothetical protein [Spiroplasma endosymbiont of Glossina fuscipes fuscipes]|uniref:hypothetical protein n=1 Tax=Spiroplasma endosymbiont of Glossina fuscipes fuscipes TaxID=2004463 RepID=UPI003CE7B541
MLNIFNTINFREKVNTDVNEIGKKLILEEWERTDQELRKQNCNGQNGYIMWGKRPLQKKQSMVILPFLEHYFVFLIKILINMNLFSYLIRKSEEKNEVELVFLLK